MKKLTLTELKGVEQIESLTNALIDSTLNGSVDPLKVHALVKKNHAALDSYLKDVRIRNIIEDSIDCYGKEDVKIDGVAYKIKTRKTIDFSNSDMWLKAKAKLKAIEAELKQLNCTEDGEQLIYKHSQFIEAKI